MAKILSKVISLTCSVVFIVFAALHTAQYLKYDVSSSVSVSRDFSLPNYSVCFNGNQTDLALTRLQTKQYSSNDRMVVGPSHVTQHDELICAHYQVNKSDRIKSLRISLNTNVTTIDSNVTFMFSGIREQFDISGSPLSSRGILTQMSLIEVSRSNNPSTDLYATRTTRKYLTGTNKHWFFSDDKKLIINQFLVISLSNYIATTIGTFFIIFGTSMFEFVNRVEIQLLTKNVKKFALSVFTLLTVYQLTLLSTQYFEYPTSTNSLIGPVERMKLPSIYICSPVNMLENCIYQDSHCFNTSIKSIIAESDPLVNMIKQVTVDKKVINSTIDINQVFFFYHYKCISININHFYWKRRKYIATISIDRSNVKRQANLFVMLSPYGQFEFVPDIAQIGSSSDINNGVEFSYRYRQLLPPPYQSRCKQSRATKFECWRECWILNPLNFNIPSNVSLTDFSVFDVYKNVNKTVGEVLTARQSNDDCYDKCTERPQCVEHEYYDLNSKKAGVSNNMTVAETYFEWPSFGLNVVELPSVTFDSYTIQAISVVSFWFGFYMMLPFEVVLKYLKDKYSSAKPLVILERVVWITFGCICIYQITDNVKEYCKYEAATFVTFERNFIYSSPIVTISTELEPSNVIQSVVSTSDYQVKQSHRKCHNFTRYTRMYQFESRLSSDSTASLMSVNFTGDSEWLVTISKNMTYSSDNCLKLSRKLSMYYMEMFRRHLLPWPYQDDCHSFTNFEQQCLNGTGNDHCNLQPCVQEDFHLYTDSSTLSDFILNRAHQLLASRNEPKMNLVNLIYDMWAMISLWTGCALLPFMTILSIKLDLLAGKCSDSQTTPVIPFED